MRVVSSPSSGGKQPTTPTIGLAVDNGTGTGATVAFTPGAYLGKTNTALSYTATSSPGSVTGSSLTSPITVNGLTTDSPYIFQHLQMELHQLHFQVFLRLISHYKFAVL